MMMTLMDVTMVTILTLSSIPISGSSRPASFPGASLGHEGEITVKTLQGDWLERSESYCLLLIKYENYELFNPTGDFPDVVHLII